MLYIITLKSNWFELGIPLWTLELVCDALFSCSAWQLSGKSRTVPRLYESDVSRISRSFVFVRSEEEREREGGGKRLSVKQREGRAMATLTRQIPSPDTFLCQPWSSFVSAAQLPFIYSKFARRWRCCFRGQSVREVRGKLCVIELSKLLRRAAGSVKSAANCL